MNGLFGRFQTPTMFSTPQQNVAQYLRMPTSQSALQQPQQPQLSTLQFATGFNPQPKPDESLNLLQKISGYGIPMETPQKQITPEEKAMMLISNKYNANTIS